MEERLIPTQEQIDKLNSEMFAFKPTVVETLVGLTKEAQAQSLQYGETFADFLLRVEVEKEDLVYFKAYVNAAEVDLGNKPGIGDSLLVVANPGFKKFFSKILAPVIKPIASVLGPQLTMVALAAAGAYLGPAISYGFSSFAVSTGSTALMTAASYFGQAISSTVGSAVSSALGSYALSQVGAAILAPTAQVQDVAPGYKESQTFALAGQSNRSKAFQPVNMVYGKRRIFPPLATSPKLLNRGDTSQVYSLLDIGVGDYVVEDIRIGDTPIAELTSNFNIEYNTKEPNVRWLHDIESYQPQNYVIKNGTEFKSRTAQKAVSATAVLTFPRGFYNAKDDGTLGTTSVELNAYYKRPNDASWTRVPFSGWSGLPLSDSGSWVVMTDAFTRARWLNVDFTFPEAGIWDVRIVNNSADSNNSRLNNQVMVASVTSRAAGNDLVDPEIPHTFLEVQAQANEKIQGNLQDVSCTVQSKLRTHNGTDWQSSVATSNPAWVVLDILTGVANREPLKDTQIDFASFVAFANRCDQQVTNTINGITSTTSRYTCNLVLDFSLTIKDLVDSILAEARAHLIVNQAGKYSIVMDDAQTVARQMFTPSNSWNFRSQRAFQDEVHAVKVQWTNPENNWAREEILVYNDGYDSTNATEIKEQSTFALTSYQEAWRYGRYMMAKMKHRQEVISISCEAESWTLDVGDLVEVALDGPKIGGLSTTINKVVGDIVTIGDPTEWSAGGKFVIRKIDGTIVEGEIDTGLTPYTFKAKNVGDLVGVKNGDLIVTGKSGYTTKTYIVDSISPTGTYTADLQLIAYIPEVYTADSGTIPDWDSGLVPGQALVTDLEITGASITSQNMYISGYDPITTVNLAWTLAGTRSNLGAIKVQLVKGTLKPVNMGEITIGLDSDAGSIDINHYTQDFAFGGGYDMYIYPVTKLGTLGKPFVITPFTITRFNTNPVNPIELYIDVDMPGDYATYSWADADNTYVRRWEIKYISPTSIYFNAANSEAMWSAGEMVGTVPGLSNTFNGPVKTGKYLLRAIGLLPAYGLKSPGYVDEYVNYDALPQGLEINAIEPELSSWSDTAEIFAVDGTAKPAPTVQTQTGEDLDGITYLVGEDLKSGDTMHYTYAPVDLEYKQQFKVNHFSDITVIRRAPMVEWLTLHSVNPILWYKNANADQYKIDAKFRIADDNPLVDPSNWSSWRSFNTDTRVNARYIQFRLEATIYGDYEILFKSGKVTLTTTPRREVLSNKLMDATVKTFAYTRGFAAIPSVHVTVVGDIDQYAEVISRTRNEITVGTFFKASGNPSTGAIVDIVADGFGQLLQ